MASKLANLRSLLVLIHCAIFYIPDVYSALKRPRFHLDENYQGGIEFPSSKHGDEQLSSPVNKRPRLLADPKFQDGGSISLGRPDEKVVDFSNPLATRDFLDSLDSGKYGSVTKEIEAILAQKMRVLYPYFEMFPSLTEKFLSMDRSGSKNDVIDLDDDDDLAQEVTPPKTPLPVITIESDEEDEETNGYHFQSVFSGAPAVGPLTKPIEVHFTFCHHWTFLNQNAVY